MQRYTIPSVILAAMITARLALAVGGSGQFNPKSTGLPLGGGVMLGDIDLNGAHSIIFDVDGDTYVNAIVDDTIFWYVGTFLVLTMNTTNFHLGDDFQLAIGGAFDYWRVYNSAGTSFEEWSANCDGVATPCAWLTLQNGTDDADFSGNVSAIHLTASGDLRVGAGQTMYWNGLTKLGAPADNQLQVCNAGETQCFTLGASAADTATLWDKAGTGAGTLELDTGYVQFGAGQRHYSNAFRLVSDTGKGMVMTQQSDNDLAEGAQLLLDSAGASEMTADGNGEVQYSIHSNPELAMTNASAFVGWEHDPEVTTQGTAQNYHYRLDWSNDGVYEQKVQDDGDIILHEDPGSDTDPLAGKVFAANAWALASAGAASNGANLEFYAGIRKMALVCATPAISDQDEIVFTVNGVAQAALVESTDWDCFGETNDDCCINLAAAIVLADYGIVPDAVSLAGTVYLTPDEDLGSVDSIVLTDSIAADGHGITLTEGVDGSVILSTGYGALTVTPTLVAFGGTTASFPALKPSATLLHLRLADDSAYTNLTLASLVALNNVRAGATYSINFDGRTKWTSSGDGIWEMGRNAGTRGARFDTETADGVLSLYDESDGPLQLKVAESDIAEAVTKSAKLTTTDALDNLIASVTLADGEVLTVEVTILGRERDGSDRNMYHIQGLFYRQGGAAVQQSVSTYLAEVESDIAWCGDLAVSGNDVQITVDGNGNTVDWEITYKYQILVSGA